MLTGNTPFENKDKMRLYDSILNVNNINIIFIYYIPLHS